MLKDNRSRSPKGQGDHKTDEAIWAEFEAKIDAKNNAFKDEVKVVVGTLVNREIERIESKIGANQKVNETNMVNLEKSLTMVWLIWGATCSKQLPTSKQSPPLPSLQVLALAQQVMVVSPHLLSQFVMRLLVLSHALVELRLHLPLLGLMM